MGVYPASLYFFIIMQIEAIASAILNHIYSGTAGLNSNIKISVEQLQDEVIAEKNTLLRE